MTFNQLLTNLDACPAAREWVGDRTPEEAVAQCPRGDWMLWLAGALELPERLMVLASARCAETIIHLMNDERSREAVRVALAYGRGEATDEELSKARAASCAAARAAYAATYAAAKEAYAATYAAAADAAYAAAAAAYAAAAAAYAASADADADAAYSAATLAAYAAGSADFDQHLTANVCREVLGAELVSLINEKISS